MIRSGFLEFCYCHEINLVLGEFSVFAERPVHAAAFSTAALGVLDRDRRGESAELAASAGRVGG